MPKIYLENLPENERELYAELIKLSSAEKRVLNQLLKDCNKDGVAWYPEENSIILSLLNREYITRNFYYHGKGFSYFVLPKAPHLFNCLFWKR